MKNFRTVLPLPNLLLDIEHQARLMTMGSCFAEHIGKRLRLMKFNVQENPFGIIYNPVSIAQNLTFLLDGNEFKKEALVEHQGLWHSFQHHGSFSKTEQAICLQHIQEELKKGQEQLKNLDYLFLSYGTAIAYCREEEIVANCHKFPANIFSKKMLSLEHIVQESASIFKRLLAHRPNLKIILTVSPVRHLREGFIDNQKSKAQLILAVHQLVEQFDNVLYFPSYEIMMDDLRDYRFYASDLMHPSEEAIEYIWEYFQAAYLSTNTQHTLAKISAVNRSVSHRALHPKTEAHQQFIRAELKKLGKLKIDLPYLDLEKEFTHFREQLY